MERKVCVCLLLSVLLQICDVQGISENTTAWAQGNNVTFLSNTVDCLKGQFCGSPTRLSFGPKMRPFSLSFHTAWNYLVFSDTGFNTMVVTSLDTYTAVYAHVGTSPSVGHVTVDWLRNNIYWADAGFGWIGLQSLKSNLTKFATNGHLRVIVSTQLEHPHGVVVAPQYRRVFWSDLGPPAKIESSDLLGHNRQVVVWQGLVSPTALSVDQSSQRLFWTDQSKHTIEACNFDGTSRRLLYYSESSFGGLSVFADYVLFIETTNQSLQGVDKNTGKQTVSQFFMPADSDKPGNLAVFSTALQPRGNNNSCDQLGCGHICMQQEQDPFCVCSSGYTLNPDGKTCQDSSTPLWKSFIVSTATQVCALPINLLFSFRYLPPIQGLYGIKCFLNESNIQRLAINSHNATLYYVTRTNSIRAYSILSGQSFVIVNVSGTIGGIAYDEVRGNIIWSETSGARIMAVDLHSGTSPTPLYTSLNSPGDLTVNTLGGQLFWVENLNTIVAGLVVSPFNKTVIVNTGLSRPHSLAFDSKKNRLYWLDLDLIGSVKIDGSDKSVFNLDSVNQYSGLAVFRNYLVWLTSSSHNMIFRTSDLRDSNSLTAFNLPNLTGLTDVVFYDAEADSPDTASCGRNNGGCDHICVVDGETPRCACKFGFRLQDDGATCVPSLVTSSVFLAIDTDQSTIYQIAADNNVSAVPVSVGSRPEITIYSQLTNEVIWFDGTKGVIKRSSLIGNFLEEVITRLSPPTNKVTSMSIDNSAGNLYFAETTVDENNGWVKVISLKNGYQRPTTVLSNVTARFLAIAPERGIMAYGSMSGSIYLSDMAGQEKGQPLTSGLPGLSGLTFIKAGESLVWSDWRTDEVKELPISTQFPFPRLQKAGSLPYSLVDGGSDLFYLSKKTRAIYRLTPGNVESRLHEFPELTALTSLALKASSTVSTACSNRNGGCSTLCIPVRNNDRKCACADGVQLQDDKKTCSDVEKCSKTIKNGVLASTCDSYPGEECGYSCADGYLARTDVPVIRCLTAGQWNVRTDLLCQRACSQQIQNGKLDASCRPTSGVSCSVTCNPADGVSSSVTCGDTGLWIPNADSICVPSQPVSQPSIKVPEELPGFAIGIIAAAAMAVVAVIVGCILYSRMRRYKGQHPEGSISDFIKSTIKKRKNSRDSTATLRYAPYPTFIPHDAESVYEEIQDEGRSNEGFVEAVDYMDPVCYPSGYITVIRGSPVDGGYLTATDSQLQLNGETPRPCSQKSTANGGYLTTKPEGVPNPTYNPLPPPDYN